MDGQLKVAIVHDWLVGGGAERVVQELHKLYPDAPIYTSYATPEWRERLDGKVVTGFLQHWPFSRLRKYVSVLRIWWFSRLNFSGYDLVISSTGNGEAKGIRVPEGTTHICYCHTPVHFYWRQYNQYVEHPGFGALDPIARAGLRLLVGVLRRWDLRASQRPHYFIANSTHIQRDIKKYYARDSIVIHPPVDVDRFSPAPPEQRNGLVSLGRQVPAKRVDIMIRACNNLERALTVVGDGPEHKRLQKMAGATVTFAPPATDIDVARYLAAGEGFLFASLEDFGITPIEAMAAGTPVIAYKAGGALDYIVPGVTGEFFAEQTTASLEAVLKRFKPEHYNPETIREHAKQFAPEVFRRKMAAYIAQVVTKP
jgi:glycosyltransferase involved in cell wall biosynthesis